MNKTVVVVESPAKAKTINRYLGTNFHVLASYGHVRDLAARNGSVNPDQDFSMIWETNERSEKQINEIAKALKGADNLYLATDPDREGEAISWHVFKILEERGYLRNTKVQRIVFHEITQSAIKQAINNPRQIDMSLVEAYLARRALDYLVGFNLSPVLWRKLPGAKSAGRVQSVALRLIVEREQAIEAFKSEEYWSITAILLNTAGSAFLARLTHFDGKKLSKLDINNQQLAAQIVNKIAPEKLHVANIEKKRVQRHPSAPFITSTLQQEASRKLGFGAARTMQIAQRLYEGVDIAGETTGLITYMRTDSVVLSQDAIKEAREFLRAEYGEKYVPAQPKQYKSKAKNAQEAHEAIRPTVLARRPQDLAPYLDEAQYRLYELIWKRTLASQMESALIDQVIVEIVNNSATLTFRANGSTQAFDGFLRLYQEGVDDEKDAPEGELLLPPLREKEALEKQSVTPHQHFTQPPPRFSEASLVKKMEELGIGRPSTYASLIQVLQDRSYVKLEKKQFTPEDRGRLVTSFLCNFFQRYVEYDFTANLEEQLDEISEGQRVWSKVMTEFWQNFSKTIEDIQPLRITEVIDKLEEDLGVYLFKGESPEQRLCSSCQQGKISLKLGKFGAFLGCSNYPSCKYTRPLSQNDNKDGPADAVTEPVEIGLDPQTQQRILFKKGPYGHYLEWEINETNQATETQEGLQGQSEEKSEAKPTRKLKKPKPIKPKRVAIPANFEKDQIDLEVAMGLKELPKIIGIHQETAEPITVAIGRFGPYVKHSDRFFSIPASQNVLNFSLDQAIALISEKSKIPKKTMAKKTSKKVTKAKAGKTNNKTVKTVSAKNKSTPKAN